MISRFFIDRPIFATVLSVVITLVGGIALYSLPMAQYPPITPPVILVSISYPGASAPVVADTVAAPIEQQVNGIEGMLYMSSQMGNDGSYTLSVTFDIGTDVNTALVMVQNRVALAMPQLPTQVQNQGITIRKKSPDMLMIVSFFSPDGRYDDVYLSNFATINVKDELLRVYGVSDVTYHGQRDYSTRVWLDPQKLAARNMTPMDVAAAIRSENLDAPAGQLGQLPAAQGQLFQLPVDTLGRLTTPEQFGDIVVKVGEATSQAPAQGIVRLRDVARVEPGAQNYNVSCRFDGRPSVGLPVYQLPGTNALDVADRVRAKMKELKARFPEGVDYSIVYDTTPFIRESVGEVFNTLRDAVILVGIVVLVFLQDWKAMILPMIDVPVSLIGTFAVMAALGFSLNNLTLFGLVLAIGIVVDDAIVVLENIERLIATGLDSRTATIKAMEEITGPILAITLVLSSVFIPCCFLGGITGQFFRQFAVTIAVSTIISAVNALTMTPSRAVMIFKTEAGSHGGHELKREALPWWFFAVVGGLLTVWLGPKYLADYLGLHPATAGAAGEASGWMSWAVTAGYFVPGMVVGGLAGWLLIRPVNAALGWLFRGFNRLFDRMTEVYGRLVGRLLRISVVILVIYVGLLGLTYWEFDRAPTGFVPQQDKGYLLLNVQLPDSASVERTQRVMTRIEKMAHETPGVKHTVGVSGQSLLLNANAPNLGSLYVMLDDFADRRSPRLTADAIAVELEDRCKREVRGAIVTAFGAPPIDGLGMTGGFKLIIEDRGNLGLAALQRISDQIVERGNKTEGLQGFFNSSRANTPWLYLDIDRTKCMALGVQIGELFNTLQVYLGSFYVNNFNEFGRSWQVNVQADQKFRGDVKDIGQLQVKNNKGQMVRLATLMDISNISGPISAMRYNMYSATAITGNPAPGASSGQAIGLLQQIADEELPRSMASDWTELAFMQLQAGSSAIWVFALAVVFVFLVLAAQYESWKLPLAVILVVPMCLLCSLIGVNLAGLDVSLFTQIGFVVLVGLASKNAILIVEFAKQSQEAGASRREATLQACRLRLRPILMTSFAFIFGVVPLVIAEGAGAEMRRSLGTTVFAGMLGVTLFGIFLTPVFYYVVQWFGGKKGPEIRHEPNRPPVRDGMAMLVGRAGHDALLDSFATQNGRSDGSVDSE
jgi:multidrug efflux pump